MASDDAKVPVFQAYMNPMLAALRASGGRATIADLEARIVQAMGLGPDVLAIPHKPDQPGRAEVSYRIAWTRTYLKKAGLIENPERGLWALTEKGAAAGTIDEYELAKKIQAAAPDEADSDGEPQAGDAEADPPGVVDVLARELKQQHEQLRAQGTLLSDAELAACYRRFRERFGPEVLAGLDGERLLLTIHERKTHDSLVYWIEFKDDEELSASFGSIAGGSALKFGIYQSAENGCWMTGTSNAQVRLSLDEAIERAREQRKQLVAGAAVLEDFARSSTPADYAQLQLRMEAAAPEVAETAWGHKYFALLYPTVLDDFHAVDYQRYHLIKLLKTPLDGRYANAQKFIGVARQLGMHVSTLGTVLNHRHGSPHVYWRVGTTSGDHSEWPRMRDGGFAAIGWTELGNLSDVHWDGASKTRLRTLMADRFPTSPSQVGKNTEQVFKFVAVAQDRDIVLAMDGMKVCGVGRIKGDYFFGENDGPFGHRRPVDWLSITDWRMPTPEGLRTTFHKLGRHAANLIEVERHILEGQTSRATPPSSVRPTRAASAPTPLTGIPARVHAALQRKRQVILYGPPGTGKTYWADVAIDELAARSWFSKAHGDLSAEEKASLKRDGAIVVCSFHPAYGYEDFLEGYRPIVTAGQLAFERRDGLFKHLCARAAGDPKRAYYLLIDEINRGDVPRIFGDLLTTLEKDKRGKEVRLPLSGDRFAVPDNVYIVATMNTADRSIALLDAALRRRFAFIELMPDSRPLDGVSVGGLPLGAWLDELNRRIVAHVGRDARNLQIGHAYLLPGGAPITDVSRFAEVLRDDIIPLLEEYCYEDFDALSRILGATIIDRANHRVDDTLFEPDRHGDLVRALLTSFSNITATTQAVAADRTDEDEPDDEDGSDSAEQVP